VLQVRRALKDILAGGAFIALGLAFSLGALGAGIVIKGFIAGEGESLGGFEWRAVILITAALLFFGITVRGLGAVPALFGTSLIASLARSRTSWREALLIAIGLTALSVVIFINALQLRLPLFGPWIPL
jgi:hypothetical protein